jgi:hypothetical protein
MVIDEEAPRLMQVVCGSYRSRRVNLLRYQACPAALRASAFRAAERDRDPGRDPLLALPGVVHTGALHPKVAVRFRTPTKESRSDVFGAT